MMQKSIDLDSRLARLLGKQLGVAVPPGGRDDGLEWDSLTHIKIILAVEEEFGVELSEEDVVETYSNVSALRSAIRRKTQDSTCAAA